MDGLTLVQLPLASPGARFRYMGPGQEECAGCPFQKLCFNLEPGQRYEVETVRPVQHPCNLHDEGKVQVVTVKPIGFSTSVESKKVRGTAITWEPIDCGYPECKNWKLCHPGAPAGKRYAIEGETSKLDCPMGYDLQRVHFKA